MGAPEPSSSPKIGRTVLGAAVLLLIAGMAAAWFMLPLEMWLETVRKWSMANPLTGALIFAAIYIAATISVTPCTPLSLLGGFAFGFTVGLPLVFVAALLGAALAFWIARTLLHDRVVRMIAGHPRLVAVDEALTEAGWKVVVLLRLSPIVPFNLQNYFYGVTEIPFRTYFLASAAGILPGTAVYVYLGATAGLAVADRSMMPAEWALVIAGLIATIAACWMIAAIARRHLDAALSRERAN